MVPNRALECIALVGMLAGCRGANAPIRAAEQIAAKDTLLRHRISEPTSWRVEDRAVVFRGPGSELGARLPETATEAVELYVAGQKLRLLPRDALRSNVALTDGRAVYPGAYPHADAIYIANAQRVEWFYLLRDARAPHRYVWDVELPAGLKMMAEPGGGLMLRDESGRPRARIPRPFAVDQTGKRRDVQIAWNGHQLEVSLDGRGLSYPVLLDPALESAIWEEKMPTMPPSVRMQAGFAYDTDRHRMTLFGGYGGSGDTWEWDGSAWSSVATTGPATRFGPGMTYDSKAKLTLLFGGLNFSDGVLGDFWGWDGTAWTQLCNTPPCNTNVPSARRFIHLVYDSHRERTVLFGGFDGTNPLGDTWEWDGSAWSQVCTTAPCNTTMPTARYNYGMTFDSKRNVTVLFSGYDNAADLSDTWEWNGTAWTRVCTGDCALSVPPARHDHQIAFDTLRGRTVLFGGYNGSLPTDTWEWDGTAWTKTAMSGPPGRYWGMLAFDSLRGRVVLFGGEDFSGQRNDTWEYHTIGGACVADGDCDTGHCVDNVCCVTSMCGTCQTCAGSSPGMCTAVVSAADTDSCAGTCDASSVCKLNGGATCSAGSECGSGFCVDTVCCNSACDNACDACSMALGASADGTCTNLAAGSAGSPSCAPFACNGLAASCPTVCTSNTHCESGKVCISGACVAPLANGEPCNTGTECVSTHCSDHVCCNTACSGVCDSCDVAPQVGECIVTPSGRTGDPTCAPFLCDGVSTSCPTSCSNSTQCSPSASCQNGVCQSLLQSNGQTCTSASECTSNFCVDGVCCNSACDGACETCDSAGTCTNAAAGAAGSPSCDAYLCNGTQASCPTMCSSDANCSSGSQCVNAQCMAKDTTPVPSSGCSMGLVPQASPPLAALMGLAMVLVRMTLRRRLRATTRRK